MNDMSSAIVPKSDQINADDLIGGPMTITINDVKITGGQEQPVSIYFAGSDKAFRPCKSMSRVLVSAWGPDAKAYIGRSLELYRDPTVKWGGMEVGGIRIRAMTDIEGPMTMALTATKGSRKPFTVRPLTAAPAKADKAADGVRALIENLRAIGPGKKAEIILASAEVVKQRAWLAEKRPELAAQVDAVVAELEQADETPFSEPAPAADSPPVEAGPAPDAGEAAAPASKVAERMARVQAEARGEGPADEHRGEQPTLDQALLEIGDCPLTELDARVTAFEGLLSDEDMDLVREAARERSRDHG